MAPLPMTVIAGYLGAGKTTLINRLLAEDHGLRLMVMVNDFGAINIDKALLASSDEDTLTLTNGCICCTMGADLFLAIGDALDRRPRPDHLIIEASGIADPGRIANAAIAEPDMSYGGIVTVVDGENFPMLDRDDLIAPQLRAQVAQADLVLMNRAGDGAAPLQERLAMLGDAPVLDAGSLQDMGRLLFGMAPPPRVGAPDAPHPAYVSWSYRGPKTLDHAAISARLETRPPGVFRMKGIINGTDGEAWEIQVVGKQTAIRKAHPGDATQLVALGLKSRLDPGEVETWWSDTPE
ncbi:GTP-binding protein [Primorskyibacter aestuariivivens]|uniref:CobW family GTP-binding protein n=1 Tax=Primorskyibacter aestuariivivens TaxID=1888912 RepID=UPI0023001EF0|nr:CobW family GTP-binding protein [Primorskyibacter aestuariivivens]MDA7429378.1 GTP-binding protein [Primorskyibacter aestuariivivens]